MQTEMHARAALICPRRLRHERCRPQNPTNEVRGSVKAFVLEDLTRIRKRTGEKGKGSKKQRKSIGSWSFNQFELFLTYKAEAAGKTVLEVDPKHTGQKCSCCGHTEKANRYGSSFVCLKCGFSLNADLIASRNILHRSISALQRLNSKPTECSLQR